MTQLDPVELWKTLHAMPELAMQEHKTAAFVAKTLRDIGVEEVKEGVGGTGVTGYIRGSQPGPVVMLRADMDALPFTIDGKPCAIHACGHDAHTAMLLAAASRLVGNVKKGAVKLCFQPAEETGAGALAMIEAGVLEDVDYALGGHIRPIQDVAAGSICPGISHSASITVKVGIDGKSAHAARPHLGVNTIDVSCQVIQAVQSMWFNPAQTWSIKATQIHADRGATNSIPDHAEITFDGRAGTNPLMEELRERFVKAVTLSAEALGATASFKWTGECPAADYDKDFKALVADSIVETVGEEHMASDCGGGGEDFHYFKLRKPTIKSAYFGLGVGATPGLHNADMHFDPKFLANGVEVFVKTVGKVLG